MTVVAPYNERDAFGQRPDAPEGDRALRLLSDLAVALGHGVQFDFLLADLATGLRRLLDADRVSVLLLDGNDRLIPAIAVARQEDAHLWQTFRRMPPIALDDLIGAREALSAGDVLVIDDATCSPFVPVAWQRAFRLSSLAIAPLSIDRVTAGIVVVDYAEPGTRFSSTDVALLQGMAALAGIALDGVRRSSHAQRASAVADALHELASAHSRRAVAEHTLTALLEVAQVTHGLVALVDDDHVDVVAVRGTGLPEPGTYEMDHVPSSILQACASAWSDPATSSLVPITSTDGHPMVVVPMTARRRVVGAAALPLVLSATPRDVIAELEAIATSCGLALRAGRHAEDCGWLTGALALASRSIEDSFDAAELVEQIRDLLGDVGVPVAGVFMERAAARALGLPPATAAVSRRIGRWQRDGSPKPVVIGTSLAWPLVSRGQVLGALLTAAESPAPSRERTRIAASVLSAGFARVLDEARALDLNRLEAQMAGHRSVAVRAYREAGQVLDELADQLRTGSSNTPRTASAARVVVEQAKRLVRDAAVSLAPEDVRPGGLRASLVATAEQVYSHGGPDVVVRQRGHLPPVDPAVQVALVRGTRRLLILLRDQRAATVTAYVEADGGQIVVRLRAPQLLSPLDTDGLQAHSALNEARSWLEPISGAAHLDHDGESRLYVLTAPTDFRRSERSVPSGPSREDSGEVVRLQR